MLDFRFKKFTKKKAIASTALCLNCGASECSYLDSDECRKQSIKLNVYKEVPIDLLKEILDPKKRKEAIGWLMRDVVAGKHLKLMPTLEEIQFRLTKKDYDDAVVAVFQTATRSSKVNSYYSDIVRFFFMHPAITTDIFEQSMYRLEEVSIEKDFFGMADVLLERAFKQDLQLYISNYQDSNFKNALRWDRKRRIIYESEIEKAEWEGCESREELREKRRVIIFESLQKFLTPEIIQHVILEYDGWLGYWIASDAPEPFLKDSELICEDSDDFSDFEDFIRTITSGISSDDDTDNEN